MNLGKESHSQLVNPESSGLGGTPEKAKQGIMHMLGVTYSFLAEEKKWVSFVGAIKCSMSLMSRNSSK